jgi:hypothetical protein
MKTAKEFQVEFERRITLMNPDFELKEKLTSDTIFSFLNAYTERFVRDNYLREDQVADGTRSQKKNQDALKGLIVRTTLSPVTKYSTASTESVTVSVTTKDDAGKETTTSSNVASVAVTTKYTDGTTTTENTSTTTNTTAEFSDTDCSSTKFILPSDYFLYIRSNSKLSQTYKGAVSADGDAHLAITSNKTIREDDVWHVLSTFDNKAILRNPYVVLNSGQNNDISEDIYLNVIHDTYTKIAAVDLVYYRKPKKFNVIGVDNVEVLDHCELPENVHMEIVEGAVEMFIVENRYRLSGNSNKNSNNQ